eukprot:187402-Pleurochrysis_carterae.AAC.1
MRRPAGTSPPPACSRSAQAQTAPHRSAAAAHLDRCLLRSWRTPTPVSHNQRNLELFCLNSSEPASCVLPPSLLDPPRLRCARLPLPIKGAGEGNGCQKEVPLLVSLHSSSRDRGE